MFPGEDSRDSWLDTLSAVDIDQVLTWCSVTSSGILVGEAVSWTGQRLIAVAAALFAVPQ